MHLRTFLPLLLSLLVAPSGLSAQATYDFSTSQRGPVIGPLHYGIFYEEINHAGDGGLYAELIRNGSMEENSNNPDYWWTIGEATFAISSDNLINAAQKRAMRLNLTKGGDGTRNIGYWGINIVAGQKYRASLWLRTSSGWKGDVTLTLESYEGADLGHAVVHVEDGSQWQKYTAEITATGSYQLGWFAIRGSRVGTLYIDQVSLFPPTFKNRENGMRRDLAEKLAALHPRFMRFPGGCYVEGGNRYQWRNTVGPVEERLGIYNSHWGYPVTNGMGFHEFLQLAEDLGAEPLFVVNVGMGHGWAQDYLHIQGYIQEALDALEYANGDVTSFWGAKRAAAGHPEPFNLRLMEIGNENYNFHADTNEDQSDHYAERYKQFYDAIKARWPEVLCIGNVESWGTDNPTWRNQHPVDIVDEHYYRSPDWFASNYHKYDNASRSSHKIYNGEYAVTQDFGVNGTLKAALGEAIYMAGMERNSDVCVMASYAPIFMNENQSQWRPDMIHYNAHSSFGTPSYWAQQMMASQVGHQNLTWTEAGTGVGLQENTRLGLGSWATDATYSNIKVTASDATVVFQQTEALHSPAATNGTAHVFDVLTDDCTIEMDAVKNSGDEGFLITFAYADGNNYAWWNLGGWGNTRHAIEQATNGNKTTLVTSDGSITTGQTYHLKIEREGLLVRCYVDDVLVNTATLSAATGQRLYLCASLNEAEDTAIVKVINYSDSEVPATFRFQDATISGRAQLRVMNNPDNYAENSMENPTNVSPVQRTLSLSGGALPYTVPAYSLSVLAIPLSEVSPEVTAQMAPPPAPLVSYSFEQSKAQDDSGELQGTFEGGASVLSLADGNKALYTGDYSGKGYMDLSSSAAKSIGQVLNGEQWSVSLNILLPEGGHLHHYCWAWNINNGTGSYAGLINQANNLNWYFEKVRSGSCKVSSHAGLSQREWHNLTVTSDAVATRIYVDGVLRGTQAPNASALSLSQATSAWLGRSPFSGDAYMTNTFFDDLAVFSSALTPGQVLYIYEAARNKAVECEALQPVPDTTPNAQALALINGATEVDITSLLQNADFSKGDTGWEGTPFSAAPGTVAEHFAQLFDTYQVLHNMPAGRYRLQWQGFYRNGNIQNAWLRYKRDASDAAEVYVSYGPDETTQAMQGIYEIEGVYTYSPYTYPDNVATANNAFAAGHYSQQMEFTTTDIADLRIGLRHFTPTVYDWACVDNFRLYYVCDPTAVEGLTAPSPASRTYDLTGRLLQGSSTQSPRSLKPGLYIINGRKVSIR